MRFEEQKYFKHYVPLYRRLSPSISQRKMTPAKNLNRTTTQKRTQSPKNKQLNTTGKKGRNVEQKPIWQLLYQEGMQQRKDIQYKHQVKQAQLDQQCTFKPILRGKSQRYLGNQYNFIDRNTIWLENKIGRQVRCMEEQTNKELRECTFSPKLNVNRNNFKRPSPKKKHEL